MQSSDFCQSCSMPMEREELRGTEKDGSKSKEYCVYCYQRGTFLNPDMKLDEMKALVKEEMEIRKLDAAIINRVLSHLPYLKRWRSKTVAY